MRIKREGVPAQGPSPWMDSKTSAMCMVLPWSGGFVGGAGVFVSVFREADQEAGDGGECDMELVDVLGGGVEVGEFLGAWLTGGRDEFEEGFVDELVISGGDDECE